MKSVSFPFSGHDWNVVVSFLNTEKTGIPQQASKEASENKESKSYVWY